ncbi:S8 family serine peptidase [Radiobacillus kanasensis]|uniref:S8 family peptidase n=1 Tax=Radiobacillus kanasensis TaxID=2844358 RepID=UPI001E54CA9D|nr:S8 family serine peptidase [Radiobacillus kanasensis]UFU01213.1 S8 family serine peptidase [Radiobacillus kanasensis]
MKKVIMFSFLCLFSSFFYSSAVVADSGDEQVIIIYKDDIDKTVVTEEDGEVDQVYHNLNMVTGEVPEEAIATIEEDPNVLLVEEDKKISISGQLLDWGISKTRVPESWKANYYGKGVKVAVLDTGIAAHQDLLITSGKSFTSYTESFYDDNGHGTHVAGIISALNNDIGVAGVAPSVNLYSVKVLDKYGSGYLSDIIAGINWSIENKMDIINLSLGTNYDSTAMKQAVDKAYASGVLVVAAAGNNGRVDGIGNTVEYPAKYSSVIAVSATDSLNRRASFSAHGQEVEIAGPGVSILSTYPSNKYVSMSGTSMATPYVTGVLALLHQANPTANDSTLRSTLAKTALDLGISGRDSLYGYGLAQAPVKSLTTPQKPAAAVTKPVVKKAQKKYTKLSVYADKSVYKLRQSMTVKGQVLDKQTGKPLAGVSVKVVVTRPKGKAKTITRTTDKKGMVRFTVSTNKKSPKGYYKYALTATKKGYQNSTASKTLRLK